MPEIPEIETVRRHLAQHVLGEQIIRVDAERPKTFNISIDELIATLQGAAFDQVVRRGKIIALQTQQPASLVFHFMLDGFLRLLYPGEELDGNYQLMLEFASNERLYFCKMYLGYIHLEPTRNPDQIPEIAELGPDPSAPDFSLTQFESLIKGRRKMVKPLLMDQDFVAGIGNTYSNEGLFRAAILPQKRASDLETPEISRLYTALRSVINQSVEMGGVGDMPFSSKDKQTGGFIPELKVSYREGEPCYVCGTPISFEKINGRNAFFCTVCQH